MLGIALVLIAVMALTGCSKSGNNNEASPSAKASSSVQPSESSKASEPAPEPTKPVKLRVMIYDRGNAPAGEKLTDAVLVKWAQEQVKPLGIDLEMVPVPRGEASTKLNVWLASGQAPDIIFTYDLNTMNKYAEQGGLWELDDLLDQYGPQIQKNNEKALEVVGKYKGKRYGIPMLRANPDTGPAFKIRQDWLDKLGMKAPTNPDELYTVLKAFKEKDPGNVGKDKVVPFAFPAIGKAFLYNMSEAFGMNPQFPANSTDMFGGKWVDDHFVSNIAAPGARDMFLFLNKLYKEGLIPKEFGTDVNSQQYNQYIAQGVAGFVEDNDYGSALSEKTHPAVPEARWMPVEPFVTPDGKQYAGSAQVFGMMIMVPKSSKEEQAIAAVKYLNWMAEPENTLTLQIGIEGVHRKQADDGTWEPIDPEKNEKEINWYAGPGDLAIIQQGQLKPTFDQLKKQAASRSYFDPDYYATAITKYFDIFDKYRTKPYIITEPRPFAEKNQEAIGKFINDSITKIIVSSDPNKEYDAMLAGWKKLGGEEYDKELTDILKKMNYQP
jgi:putative aldouronate transport system substrate-binding protein